ncbi:MAG TPA: diguanylate cyclase [Edaphobacter sp.]|nr:diguanylate cyclase [Edaphobacter sp.]
MDYKTSFIFFIVSLGLFSVALTSLAVVDKTVSGARWLAASTLIDFFRTLLQALMGSAPPTVTLFLANELSIASFALMFVGLRWFIVRTPFRRWDLAGLLVGYMALYAVFFHRPVSHWSFVVAALPILAMGASLTWMLLRQRDSRFVIPSRMTGAFLGVYTVVMTYRCRLSLHQLSRSVDSPWANPAWMYSMLALMLMSYCLLLMYVLFTVVEMHSSVAYAAGIDPLTGALNRRSWTKHASQILARCERREQPVALVAIDLDNFKRVNDTYGHGGGDVTLCAFVDLVKEQLRPEDMVVRLGGEEFALLLPDMDMVDAARAAESLRRSLEQMRVHYDGRMIQTTASAGVTEMQPGDSLEDMLKRADDLLYRAKSEGRNLVLTEESIAFPARPVLVERFEMQTERTA